MAETRNDFTSEIYKLELRNLPKFGFGVSVWFGFGVIIINSDPYFLIIFYPIFPIGIEEIFKNETTVESSENQGCL